MIEEWVDLCDEEGNHGEFYQVSSLGRVRMLDRAVRTKGGATAIRKGRLKAQTLHNNGYLVVGYTVNGRLKQRQVNRVVAFSFYGQPPEPGMEACHGNGDRLDNRKGNIRWDTKLGNAADKKLHGTDNRGATNPRAVLTERQVDIILDLAALNEPQNEIAASLGVHRCAVNHVLTGRTWSTYTGMGS
ncbi:MAG TPA: NUMOD4 motif-containing HNH endonuclease [Candidatus Sphingomonas excrementigallinarum]|nr:NUMOD4 motif-containing HNH endonuclease [Candidatus Sphingomonas excrementigallinarum]